MGRCGEMWGDVGRHATRRARQEARGDTGRDGERWERWGEMETRIPRPPAACRGMPLCIRCESVPPAPRGALNTPHDAACPPPGLAVLLTTVDHGRRRSTAERLRRGVRGGSLSAPAMREQAGGLRSGRRIRGARTSAREDHALRCIPPHSAVLTLCACSSYARAALHTLHESNGSPAPRLASPSRRLAVLTYGNGVPKALEARAACGVEADVIDSPGGVNSVSSHLAAVNRRTSSTARCSRGCPRRRAHPRAPGLCTVRCRGRSSCMLPWA